MGKVRKLSNSELREAIKRNDLEVGIHDSLEWIKSHLENVLIAVVLIVVGVVLVPYYLASQDSQNAEAALQLRAANAEFQNAVQGGGTEALRQARSKFQAVSASYSGSAQAAQAALGAASSDLALGELDQASANFQGFWSQYGENHILAPMAIAGLARVMEGKGQYAQAAEQYLKVDGRSPQAPNLGISLLDAVRCYRLAGQSDQAQALLVRAQKDQTALGLSPRLLALAGISVKKGQ